jgi:hypothetical protein
MFKIYFTNEHGEARSYNEESLTTALATAEGLRRNTRYSFVTMVSENPNCTSLSGVDSVKDMILPNGAEYGYVKRRYK